MYHFFKKAAVITTGSTLIALPVALGVKQQKALEKKNPGYTAHFEVNPYLVAGMPSGRWTLKPKSPESSHEQQEILETENSLKK